MPTLNFKGKSIIRTHHLSVPYRQLVPHPRKSVLPAKAKPSLDDNLIIHGDNLEALKALQPSFQGLIKCIYIDPPYNTGSKKGGKWKYYDNVNSPMHQEWLGRNVDREDLTRHDKWLCMMWPRLTLLRDLLHDSGLILISIDDHEVHHLRAIMDEIFFEENFIAQLVWEKGRKNDAKLFSVGHEYMLVYARSLETLRSLNTVWREPKPGAQEIWDKYLELRKEYGGVDETIGIELGKWYRKLPKNHPSRRLSRYRRVDKWGPWRDHDISWPGGGGPTYDVPHPITHTPCKVPDGGWRFATSQEMQRQITLDLIVFREDHTEPPFRKTHLRPIPEELEEDYDAVIDDEEEENEEEQGVGAQVMPSVIYKQSQVAVKYLRQIMGKKAFENPKDHEVIARLIWYVTAADPSALVLDSFAGTGTTGEAVLAANLKDKGRRRFILVEQEDYADELTAERLRQVIKGLPDAKDARLQQGYGGSFSFFSLGPSLDDDRILRGTELPSYNDLARYVFFTATGEQWDESQSHEGSFYIGESMRYQVYLIYRPDIGFIKNTPLDLGFALNLPPYTPNADKLRLVIASHKYLDEDRLRDFGIEFCQLPFSIYKFRA